MIEWGAVNPDDLEQGFRLDVQTLLALSPFTWRVTSGYRSLEMQRVLYKKHLAGGPLAAPPGRSAHNYGLAIDVVPDGDVKKSGFQPDWQPNPGDGWYWLAMKVDEHPRLRHGRHFGDWPHLQRLNWQSYKNARVTQPPLRAA